MSQGGYVTLVGFVARDPIIRQTKQGTNVTDLRVGTTTRILDRTTGEWRDGDTNYYTVKCWRRLADHTKASLHKGEPVMVKGRFRTPSYEDKTGQLKTEVEIEADAIGHDLSRGISNYIRTRTPADTADGRADGSARTDDSARTGDSAWPAAAPAPTAVPRTTSRRNTAMATTSSTTRRSSSSSANSAQACPGTSSRHRPLTRTTRRKEDDEHEAIGTPGTPRTPEASMPI